MTLPFETDTERLGYLQDLGEEFDSGFTSNLWGIFNRRYFGTDVGGQAVESRETSLYVRTSDINTHGLTKGGQLEQLSNADKFRIVRFEPDGTGMTTIVLSR